MILFIDACTREKSRTRELAKSVLANIPYDGSREETVNLYDTEFSPVTEDIIAKRDAALSAGDFSDPYFAPAKQFAEAETIIIAAPYWDLSFPAVLKLYIENVSVNGVTFEYDEYGIPHGLCHAKKLYYVTTAGGEIGKNNFGYEYVKAVSLGLFGIEDASCIRAVGLDIASVDAEKILENAKNQLKSLIVS